jgi:hypothetical protein
MVHTIRKREGLNLNAILNNLRNIARSIELMKPGDARIRDKFWQTYMSHDGHIARIMEASCRSL